MSQKSAMLRAGLPGAVDGYRCFGQRRHLLFAHRHCLKRLTASSLVFSLPKCCLFLTSIQRLKEAISTSKAQEAQYQASHPNLRKLNDSGQLGTRARPHLDSGVGSGTDGVSGTQWHSQGVGSVCVMAWLFPHPVEDGIRKWGPVSH